VFFFVVVVVALVFLFVCFWSCGWSEEVLWKWGVQWAVHEGPTVGSFSGSREDG